MMIAECDAKSKSKSQLNLTQYTKKHTKRNNVMRFNIDKLMKLGSTLSTVTAVAAAAAYSCLYTVDGGERAVIWDMGGVKPYSIGEGTHFFIPIKQKPHIYDIRIRPRSIKTTTGTKDLQTANLTLRILHRPDVEHLPEIFKQLGMHYDETILPSIANETLKAVVALYNAEELITMREKVSDEIRKIITVEGAKFNILFEDISITDLTFGREFTQAVENKQVAQQDAERQKFLVMFAEQEKMANVIRSEGESEAARLISEAIVKSGQGLVELRRIEASKEIAKKLAQSGSIVYLPSQSNYLIAPKQ